jgi:hypothetical protein
MRRFRSRRVDFVMSDAVSAIAKFERRRWRKPDRFVPKGDIPIKLCRHLFEEYLCLGIAWALEVRLNGDHAYGQCRHRFLAECPRSRAQLLGAALYRANFRAVAVRLRSHRRSYARRHDRGDREAHPRCRAAAFCTRGPLHGRLHRLRNDAAGAGARREARAPRHRASSRDARTDGAAPSPY